ncbi:efflux RND transporter permease subunit, partial [bacterium LRH843]|nr:efflux RND transporter permease subunit [bacterium LRH843]
SEDDSVLYLRDVADIDLGKDEGMNSWDPRFNGGIAVFAGLNKMSGGNMLDISNRVKDILPDIQASLPEGMTVTEGYNFSLFISASLD